MSKEKVDTFFPNEDNLGQDCMFWNSQVPDVGCMCPRIEVQGRISCEGIIDEVCLFLKDNRDTNKIPPAEKVLLRIHAPLFKDKHYIPPDRDL